MAAAERWAQFLSQIESRHTALAVEFATGAVTRLVSLGYDSTKVIAEWSVLQRRLQELEHKITDTWSDQVEPLFESEGLPADVTYAACDRGRDVQFTLECKRESAYHRGCSSMCNVVLERAASAPARTCPSCRTPLSLGLIGQVFDATCTRCGATFTYEPGPLLAQVEVLAHSLAWVAAEPLWHVMREVERRAKAARSPAPLALLKAEEKATLDYWTAYHVARQPYSAHGMDVAAETRAKMQFWYTYRAELEAEWKAAYPSARRQ